MRIAEAVFERERYGEDFYLRGHRKIYFCTDALFKLYPALRNSKRLTISLHDRPAKDRLEIRLKYVSWSTPIGIRLLIPELRNQYIQYSLREYVWRTVAKRVPGKLRTHNSYTVDISVFAEFEYE